MRVKLPDVTVDPLGVLHTLLCDGFLDGGFLLLILLDVVDEFAVRVVAGIEVRAVAKAFVGLLVDNGPEVLFGAEGVPFGLLALVTSAVVAILQILFALELQYFDFLLVAREALQLPHS